MIWVLYTSDLLSLGKKSLIGIILAFSELAKRDDTTFLITI